VKSKDSFFWGGVGGPSSFSPCQKSIVNFRLGVVQRLVEDVFSCRAQNWGAGRPSRRRKGSSDAPEGLASLVAQDKLLLTLQAVEPSQRRLLLPVSLQGRAGPAAQQKLVGLTRQLERVLCQKSWKAHARAGRSIVTPPKGRPPVPAFPPPPTADTKGVHSLKRSAVNNPRHE